MAWNRAIRRGWSVPWLWAGPTWEYTILAIHHRMYRDGASSVAFHSVVVLRDGLVQARLEHTEVINLSLDPSVQSTWFEQYLPSRLNDPGEQGWRIVSVSYGSPIRVVFVRRT